MLQESNMKKGPTIAAKQYHTNRQFVYRQLEKWNGDVRSLALKSRRPKTHPNAHTEQEIELIMRMYESYSDYGLAEVYKQCKRNNYTRSYGSMCKIIINIISGAGTVNDGAMLGYHKDSKVTSEHYVKAKEEEEIKLRLLELRKRAGL